MRFLLSPGIVLRAQVHVDLRAVTVNVLVYGAIVLVTMRVHDGAMAVVRHISVGDASRYAGQIEDAEQDQHQADRQLHGEADARRNDHVEQNNGGADTEDGDGMADAPKGANDRGLPDAALPADNRGNSDDVIRVRRMAHAENKSQTDCCQQIHHAAISTP